MKPKIILCAAAIAALLSGCASQSLEGRPTITEGETSMVISDTEKRTEAILDFYKQPENGNPISAQIYCADPTAVEYGGRLYVYGTNDHQQYESVGEEGKNTYGDIRSIVVFSTEDMVNWTYHGAIDVGAIAPWIYASWAPTIISRVEEDGLTHFYLYFSNSGAGVGVITSTDPVTGWSDPLGKPLISSSTEGLGDCPNPFDPGAVIDDDGVGWIAFGAGKAADGSDYMTKAARIARLGSVLISIEEIAEIPDYYHFEASELNYINGTYVYTYNTSWDERYRWEEPTDPPAACSMAYMTTKTPLVPESWEYRGHYFLNPGESGESYSNNHTHLHKFNGKYYVIYHTLALQDAKDIHGGFRSLGIEEIDVDEDTLEISLIGASKEGTKQTEKLNPYYAHPGAEMSNCREIEFESSEGELNPVSPVSKSSGAWISLRGAKLSGGSRLYLRVKGSGRVELRLGSPDGKTAAAIDFDSAEPATFYTEDLKGFSGTKDIYLVFSNPGITLYAWQAEK